MSATILTYEAQQMSAIFPTKPPEGTLHFVPKNAEFISYYVEDTLTLSAWMPDGFYNVEADFTEDNDQFFERHCDGCYRNCHSFLDEYAGRIFLTDTVRFMMMVITGKTALEDTKRKKKTSTFLSQIWSLRLVFPI